jgi:outer membrane protein assembly factor BamD (BamD/ComL family)
MRNLLATAIAFLSAAAAARAQDTIKMKEGGGQDLVGEVQTLSHKVVEYELPAAPGVKQPVDAKKVAEIIPDSNRKTFDFATGETAMTGGDFDQAIDRFSRVLRDARANELIKQIAAINLVKCRWMRDDLAGTVAAAQELRKLQPQSFFLRESFEYEIRAHLAKGDNDAASKAVAAFEEKGRADGMTEWPKSAEVMRGRLLELQGKHKEALAIHRKYARDRDAGEDASLGELRCLTALSDWSALASRADQVIIDAKGRRSASRLLTGAYNAKGEANLSSGKVKEALLDFLQGAMVLNKGGESTIEHEASLGRGAVACAKYAATLKEKSEKDKYKGRAQELVAELDKFYPNSRYRADALKAIQEVK